MDLLKFVPPINYEYYETLKRTSREDGSSNTANEADIIMMITKFKQCNNTRNII